MLNVAVIGLGVGEKHAQAYAAHPGCRVVALCDLDQDRLSACASAHPKARLTTDATSVLNDPNIQAVSIASFDDAHCAQVVQAIEHGKHVFVEKPLCLFYEELSSIRTALTKQPDIHLSSNLNLRTCPRFKRLKELIQSGELGKVFHIDADYLWGRLQKLTKDWRGDMEFYSIIHGAAVHMIDLVLWATGKKPTKVQGMGNRISTSGTKVRYNDFATLLLSFEDGMVAKIGANAGCVHPHFHRVSAYGTQKTFVHEYSGARLYDSRSPQDEPLPVKEAYPGVANKKDLIFSFVDTVLKTNSAPLVTEQDVFNTMSVCLATEQAIQTGTSVEIAYL